MPYPEFFHSTIEAIYDAGTNPARWPLALDALRSLTDAPISTLTVVRGQQMPIEQMQGSDPALMGRMQVMLDENLWFQRAHLAPVGKAVAGELMATKDEIKRTRVYDEILRPADALHMCGVSFIPASGLWGAVTIHRSERRGPFGTRTCDLLDAVAPHLVRAAKLNGYLADLDLYTLSLEAMADRVSFGLILLDARGAPAFVNARARGYLSAGRLARGRDGRLRPPATLGNGGFGDWLGRITTGREVAALRVVGADGTALRLVGAPLADARRDVAVLAPAARAVVFVFGDRHPPTRRRLLAQLYGLTPAEAQLAVALMGGVTLSEHARDSAHSRNTLKTQLAAIFRKTGTSRQAELVRLLSEVTLIAARPAGSA